MVIGQTVIGQTVIDMVMDMGHGHWSLVIGQTHGQALSRGRITPSLLVIVW